MNLNARFKGELSKVFQEQALKEQNLNKYALRESVSISDRTAKRYKKEGKILDRVGAVKPPHRIDAFLNIRNALSCCATLTALEDIINFELFFSEDDVGLKLNGWDHKPQLLTTKEANAYLRKNNLSLSTTEEALKQRMVQLGATIQAVIGNTPCTFMKFADRNFDELKEKPIIWVMNNYTNFYICLYHPDINETNLQHYL